MAENRPNILLIHSDQHRADCMGNAGHPLLKTPNLDRLATEGTRFTHACCTAPICVVTRTSMLTGQWPSQHGTICNFDCNAFKAIDPDAQTFAKDLRGAGYTTGYVGKWHVHPTLEPTDFGFDRYVGNHGYRAWRKEQGLPPTPTEGSWFGNPDPHVTPEQSALGWMARQTTDMLREMSESGQPWFMRWDPPEPHLPNRPCEPFASMYDPATIPPWPSFPDPLHGKPYAQKQQLRTWNLENHTWEQWQPAVSRYFGDISLMDQQIGHVLDTLDKLGLAENTLVIYSSDHGDMCGAHGMIDKHFVMYDDVLRVPMIARWPGVFRPGGTDDRFISGAIDLAATFYDAAGLSLPEKHAGRSIRSDAVRQDIFSAYDGNQFGLYTQRCVRDRRWKYVWNFTAEDELYDCERDPGELTNLATDPAVAAELSRLRQRMFHWMEETNDIMLNQWTRSHLVEGRKV